MVEGMVEAGSGWGRLAMIDVNLEVNKMMIAWIFLFLGRRQKKNETLR